MTRLSMMRGLAVATALLASPAGAAEIQVLTTGAYKPVLSDLAAGFESATGHTVVVKNETAGALVKIIEGGAAFDLVVLTPGALKDLAAKGFVAPQPQIELARVGIGVAVKQGRPSPDISSTDAFKAMLSRARSVAMIDPASGGSSGIYLDRLFQQWGIADQVRAKAVLVPGGLVATRLVSDEAELALHQISEILAVPGVTLVGPLPAEIQQFTVYAAALSAKALQGEAAGALMRHLAGPQAAEVLRRRGMVGAGS